MIFKINFFLFSFAQSNIWSYFCVYAKHYANITNAEFAILAMTLPLLAFFAKPTSCSLADAKGLHKQFLIGFLALFGTSFGSLAILAFLKDPDDHSKDFIAWIVLSFLMCCGYTAQACVCCMNDALASNYARKNNVAYGSLKVWSSIGWASGALLMMGIGKITWLPDRVPGLFLLMIAVIIDLVFLVFWPYDDDFEMFHDGSTVEQRKLSIVGPNTKALLAQNRPRGSISRDMLERIKTGRSKSVGNLPRMNQAALNGPLTLPIEKKPGKEEKEPKEYSNFQIQMMLIKMIAVGHKSFVRYIGLFVLFGLVQGMIWTYQMDYVKLRIATDEAHFEFISTLCMVAQALCGEIPILLISAPLQRLFGSNANMSLALVSLGLRSFFYGNLLPYLNPLTIIMAEALQGPSLGLYFILIVDVGGNYALMVTDYLPELKKRGIVRDVHHEEELKGCLRASMIGAMSSSMEGLGVALGSLFGGMVTSSLGYDFMWNFCTMITISIGFLNIGWDVATKLIFKKAPKSTNTEIPKILVENVDIKL